MQFSSRQCTSGTLSLKKTNTFGFEVGQCPIGVRLVHFGVKIYAGCVISDRLLEVFALDCFIAFDSLGFGHLLASALIVIFLFVVEVRFEVFELIFGGLGVLLGELFGFEIFLPIEKLILDFLFGL